MKTNEIDIIDDDDFFFLFIYFFFYALITHLPSKKILGPLYFLRRGNKRIVLNLFIDFFGHHRIFFIYIILRALILQEFVLCLV